MANDANQTPVADDTVDTREDKVIVDTDGTNGATVRVIPKDEQPAPDAGDAAKSDKKSK